MIERLASGDGARLRAIRLRALRDAPDAFATTLDEASAWDARQWAEQVEAIATFVWHEGDADLGMVRAVPHDHDPEAGYLISLWVDPAARGRGIGQALIGAVVGWARARALRCVYLDVGTANRRARSAYERAGFTVSAEAGTMSAPRAGMCEVQMRLDLVDDEPRRVRERRPAATTEPAYFASPAAFRDWLEAHHQSAEEVLVGYHKKGTLTPSMSWSESVDEALCFGWIDGIRRRVDDGRYTIRFTPRRKGSNWSRVNLAKVETLIAQGRMRPAGMAAYEARDRAAIAALGDVETAETFPAPYAQAFAERNERAAAFFEAQSPSYRRSAIDWVVSAKKEETRWRRFEQIVEASAEGRRWMPGVPRSAQR